MMYEYLKKKGIGGMNEHEFMDMFDSRSDRFSDRFNESGMGGNDMDKMMRYMRNWFGDGIEQKIVESAIVFWFKDADCKAENKVVEYLGEY